MSFARHEAAVEDDPAAEEQGANERLQPIEDQHGAGGPFAHKPTERRNGVEPKGGDERTDGHGRSEKSEVGSRNGEAGNRRAKFD